MAGYYTVQRSQVPKSRRADPTRYQHPNREPRVDRRVTVRVDPTTAPSVIVAILALVLAGDL